MKRIGIGFLVASFGALLALAAPFLLTVLRPASSQAIYVPSKILDVQRVGPSPLLASYGLEKIPVNFVISNISDSLIEQLDIEVGCGQRIFGPIPESLAPGQSFEVTAQFLAPPRGIASRSVPVYIGRERLPSASLKVDIETPIVPPLLLNPISSYSLTTIIGEEEPISISIDTIEATGTQPWIEGVQPDADMPVTFEKQSVNETADRDPRYCLRRYRFLAHIDCHVAGEHKGKAAISTSEATKALEALIPLRLTILSRASCHPDSLKFSKKNRQLRISVVDRVRGEIAVLRPRDPHVVSIVKDEKGPSGAFLAEWLDNVESAAKSTEIDVLLDGAVVASLPASWEP
jgi:hypothetical protein